MFAENSDSVCFPGSKDGASWRKTQRPLPSFQLCTLNCVEEARPPLHSFLTVTVIARLLRQKDHTCVHIYIYSKRLASSCPSPPQVNRPSNQSSNLPSSFSTSGLKPVCIPSCSSRSLLYADIRVTVPLSQGNKQCKGEHSTAQHGIRETVPLTQGNKQCNEEHSTARHGTFG